MPSEINGNIPDARFWTSRKFWLTVLGAATFLALALTKTMTFTNTEAITVILGLVGFNIGAHTVTDIASLVTRRQGGIADQGLNGTILHDVTPAFLEGMLTDVVADQLEQILPDQKDGGSSLRSSLEDRETPIETPMPRDVEEDDENA